MMARSTREEAEDFMLAFCHRTKQPIIARSTELEVIRVLAGYISEHRDREPLPRSAPAFDETDEDRPY